MPLGSVLLHVPEIIPLPAHCLVLSLHLICVISKDGKRALNSGDHLILKQILQLLSFHLILKTSLLCLLNVFITTGFAKGGIRKEPP